MTHPKSAFSKRVKTSLLPGSLLALSLALSVVSGSMPGHSETAPGAQAEAVSRQSSLPIPIVFTSRNGTASFNAVLPRPDEKFPGTSVPRAIPGKLRILHPSGKVDELSWGKKLPDSSTIVDVMSPAVSMDGKKIVFAGIKSKDDHFRLYQVDIDGGGLQQLTGLGNDPGCVELPYLRYGKDGKKLSGAARRRIDYDDLDPAYLPDGRIVFASTRLPRLSLFGGGRVTNLWVMNGDGSDKHQITFNLSGERWPYVLKDGRILFSYWSRTLTRAGNKELISGQSEQMLAEKALKKGVEIISGELPNNWWPAVVNPDGTDFRALTKPQSSAIHARPLFNGNIVYSTHEDASMSESPYKSVLQQVPAGYIGQASGGLYGKDDGFPFHEAGMIPGPGHRYTDKGIKAEPDANEIAWALAPSALPGGRVLFSYARHRAAGGAKDNDKVDFGLYVSGDDWAEMNRILRKKYGPEYNPFARSDELNREFEMMVSLAKVFDEKGSCEADAQAVYARSCIIREDQRRRYRGRLRLADGRSYSGPIGGVSSPDIYANPVADAPGQKTDEGEGPLFVPPPQGLIKAIEFYTVRLERDEEGLARDKLRLELAARSKVTQAGGFVVKVPAGIQLMQIGRDASGSIATWQGRAKDSHGRSGKYVAFAGDHFGYATEGVERNFCVGCHAGHTVMPAKDLADVLK